MQEELRSFNAVAKGKLLPSPLFEKIFLLFILVMKKMTMVLSSSSIFFPCK